MGLINCIEFNGNNILFRPNEYRLGGNKKIGVKFQSAVDTGLMVCNYFVTSNNEKIMLTEDCLINDLDDIGDKISEIEGLM